MSGGISSRTSIDKETIGDCSLVNELCGVPMTQENEHDSAADIRHLIYTHFRWGWSMLLVFLTLGFFLEALHAFKSGFYLDASSETRRLMWTLAHAHGTLFSLVHMAFAAYLSTPVDWPRRRLKLASHSLVGGTLLLPISFFLSGLYIYDGDPGLFVYLAPFGALLLFVAVFLITWSAMASRPKEQNKDPAQDRP